MDTIILIDTGVAGCEKDIFEYIRSTNRDPSEIALIILTHSNPDNIGAAWAIQQLTGCSIAAHPAERTWIEDADLQNRERPVPGFATLVGGSVQVDHELVDGDAIEPDDTRAGEMQVLYTPGLRRVQYRSSCTMKERFFLAMQSRLREICRFMMMPFYPCDQ